MCVRRLGEQCLLMTPTALSVLATRRALPRERITLVVVRPLLSWPSPAALGTGITYGPRVNSYVSVTRVDAIFPLVVSLFNKAISPLPVLTVRVVKCGMASWQLLPLKAAFGPTVFARKFPFSGSKGIKLTFSLLSNGRTLRLGLCYYTEHLSRRVAIGRIVRV